MLLLLQTIVFAQEDAFGKSSVYSKTVKVFKQFCVGKHDHFCSAKTFYVL